MNCIKTTTYRSLPRLDVYVTTVEHADDQPRPNRRRAPNARASGSRGLALGRDPATAGPQRAADGREGDRAGARHGAQHVPAHPARARRRGAGGGRRRTKRYSLGSACCRSPAASSRRNSFPAAVQPVLDRLSRHGASPRSASKSRARSHGRLASVAFDRSRSACIVDVGSRFPALISATGRLVAAFSKAPWSEIERASGAAVAECTGYQDVAQGGRSGAQEGLQHRPRQLHQRRDRRGSPGVRYAKRVTHTLVAAGVADQLDGPRSIALRQADAGRSHLAIRIVLAKG